MQLFKGCAEEYKKRHDELWPELQSLLKGSGISEYSIFLDQATGALFGLLQIEDPSMMAKLPIEPIMQRWWDYMSDLMETNADKSPVSIPLDEVFYLP